ncbi:MAG: dethiobiotin synthase [Rhodocyclaceae bacterium]|nr:dethiobiotin synthase [Rhodocyclaceae bacterium]
MSAYFITGTGTDIGKTWLSCSLLKYWRAAGLTTRAYKPVLSGFDANNAVASDAGQLLAAQGIEVNANTVDEIAPSRFAAPLSPDMAAALERREINFNELVSFTQQRCSREFAMYRIAPAQRVGSAMPTLHNNSNSQVDRTIVEGVGGVMVPLDESHTVRDWIAASNLPCILVAGSYLGSISHTLSALAALREVNVEVKAIAVNESLASSVMLADTIVSLQRHAKGIAIVGILRDAPEIGIATLAAMR